MRILSIFFVIVISVIPSKLHSQEFLSDVNYIIPTNYNQSKSLRKANVELPFFDDFSKKFGAPDPILWIGPDVYINNTYSNNPVNIGIATFDAINASGEMHSNATAIEFLADTLLSQPINLYYPGDNSIYLSFYYEAAGLGDMPEDDDVLELYFFAPIENSWDLIWSSANEDTIINKFSQIILPVNEEKYLQKGFQFKFQNFASTPSDLNQISKYSNCDHWNVDYVYLNRNRNQNDTIYDGDIGLVSAKTLIFKDYSSVPWKHFTEETEGSLLENPLQFQITYRNQGYLFPNVIRKFSVSDLLYNNPSYNFTGGADTINSFETIQYSRNFLFDFYIDDAKDSAKYEFRSFLVTDTDIENKHFRWNDTIRLEQNFYNYYAYDDGSAENGYFLYGEGVKNANVAYKYNSLVKDSLRSISIFFNQAQNNANVNYFILKVWNDNNGEPGEELISQLNNKPEFEDGLNKFVEFKLDSVIAIYGSFYIGWQQTTEDALNLGFDSNNYINDTIYSGEDYRIKNKNLFFNISGEWEQSSFQGSLMMRPVFERTNILNSAFEPELKNLDFELYPNPASDIIHLLPGENFVNDLSDLYVSIYSLSGISMYSGKYTETIETNRFSNGLYLIRITNNRNINLTKKLIIQHQ